MTLIGLFTIRIGRNARHQRQLDLASPARDVELNMRITGKPALKFFYDSAYNKFV